MHNLFPEQQQLLDRVSKSLRSDKHLQSYLILGPKHLTNINLVKSLVANAFCEFSSIACLECRNCRLALDLCHPDLTYITNLDSNVIKIDSIRGLQLNIYKSNSIAKRRLVVINPAEKMNLQAANSLLKVLEEPPEHTIFVLFAENVTSLPVTVISRCHKYFIQDFSLSDDIQNSSYLSLGSYYPEDHERSRLRELKANYISKLQAICAEELSVCELAAELQEFKLENTLWFLYLLTTDLIKYLAINPALEEVTHDELQTFLHSQNLAKLYKQLDRIAGFMKKCSANIALNSSLVLESTLLGYKNVS